MLDNLLHALTIVAWIFFGLYLLLAGLRAFQIGGLREVTQVLLSLRSAGALTILLAITVLSASLIFIEPQKVGMVISVLSQDGYREQPMRSGLHWIVPLAERVIQYPIYWQNYTMSTEPLEGSKVGNDAIAARTSDGQQVYVDCTVIFRIDASEVIRVHIDLQDRYINDFVRPVLRGIIRTEVSQFTAEEVNSSRRKNLEASLDDLMREAFQEKGFVLDRFLLRNISFSPEYARAIEQKQVAEQAQIQREYEAEQMRRLAQGERDKLRIEADGRAQAIVLEGEAQARVILLKAEAEAQALRLINEVLELNPDLITFRYIDKLSPAIRAMLVPNDNPYLLPLPDIFNIDDLAPMVTPSPTPLEGSNGSTGSPTPAPSPQATPTPITSPTPTATP